MPNAREPDWSKYENFVREEFVCSCGCGQALMRTELMDRLQAIRTELGEPLHITSGYRCPSYNARISSTGPNGPHTLGLAVDIGCYGDKAHRVLKTALAHDVPRVGIAQKGASSSRFLHLDLIKSSISPWVWSY